MPSPKCARSETSGSAMQISRSLVTASATCAYLHHRVDKCRVIIDEVSGERWTFAMIAVGGARPLAEHGVAALIHDRLRGLKQEIAARS